MTEETWVSPRMQLPLEMLVRVLANGGSVFDQGHEHAMADDGSLCVVMKDDNEGEILYRVDCDLRALKAMAERIGPNELWLKCCEIVLKKDRKCTRS